MQYKWFTLKININIFVSLITFHNIDIYMLSTSCYNKISFQINIKGLKQWLNKNILLFLKFCKNIYSESQKKRDGRIFWKLTWDQKTERHIFHIFEKIYIMTWNSTPMSTPRGRGGGRSEGNFKILNKNILLQMLVPYKK